MFRSIYRPLAWTIFLITSAGFTLISCPTQPGKSHDNEPDTTSNDFSWTIDTLGNPQYGSSSLSDVAIIDQDNIWVVGEINTDSGEYNAARWDGERWHLMGIYSNTLDLYSIQYFAANDIWVTSHCFPYHWDGSTWTQCHLNNMGFEGACAGNAIWGTASSNIYFVGNNGTIVHYDGTTFTRLASGTDLDIRDIWGATDPITGQMQILAVASNDTRRQLLEIRGTTVQSLPVQGLATDIAGVWFIPHQIYYVVGAGIHYKRTLDDTTWRRYPPGAVTSYYSEGVRGTGVNNVFVAGSFLELVHFNGLYWHNFRAVIPPRSGAVGPVAVSKDQMVTVGLIGQQAIIIRGKRND